MGAAIETSALRLVAELGFDAVSMDRIAAEAGVGKPTIYRRWNSKADLVVDAVRRRLAQVPDPVDTGSLRGDLLALFGARADQLGRDEQVALGVVAALRGHPDLHRAVRAVTEQLTRRHSRTVLDRAHERGELGADQLDDFPLLAAEALFMGHAVLAGGPTDRAFLQRAVEELLLPALIRPPTVPGPTAENG